MRKTALSLGLLLVACSSAAPQTHRYLLPNEVPAGTARMQAPLQIGLGRIEVAPYLGAPGLVVETETHQIRPARYHIWAEPLADGLRRLLRAEISKELGYDVSADTTQQARWDHTVDIQIDRLHGTLTGKAVLVAQWRIVPKSGDVSAFRFSESRPLPRDGYPGLVEAEIALTRQLARAIAESLRGG